MDNDTERVLQACLDLTDWSVFEAAENDLDELTETVTSYISSCEDKITGLNDYRLVALTSVVMKSFEKLVLAHLKDITGPSVDPLQFANRANRYVDDAVNMGLHYVLQHLDRPGAYVRILFVDFSSAFNTIILNLLLPKVTQFSMPTSICHWINSFLTDRRDRHE